MVVSALVLAAPSASASEARATAVGKGLLWGGGAALVVGAVGLGLSGSYVVAEASKNRTTAPLLGVGLGLTVTSLPVVTMGGVMRAKGTLPRRDARVHATKLKIAGGVTLGAGIVLLTAGAVVGVINEALEDCAQQEAEGENAYGCRASSAWAVVPGMLTVPVGAALLGAGVTLDRRVKKRRVSLRVVPQLGAGMFGLSIAGRF